MNPRNTFYRDSRALSFFLSRIRSSVSAPSLSLSAFTSFLSFLLFSLFVKEETERERKRRTLTLYDDSVSQSSRELAGILSRGTTNEEEASVENRKRNGPRADDIFSLDGWDTSSRVYTRESSMPRREETAGVGRYTHKRRNAILIIGCDYLCRVTPSHREASVYSSSSVLVLWPNVSTPARAKPANHFPLFSSLIFSLFPSRDRETFRVFRSSDFR